MSLNMVNLMATSSASPSSTNASAQSTESGDSGDSFESLLGNSLTSRSDKQSGDTSSDGQTSMTPLAQAVKQHAGNQKDNDDTSGLSRGMRNNALLAQLTQQTSRQEGLQQATGINAQSDGDESATLLSLQALLGGKTLLGEKALSGAVGDRGIEKTSQHTTSKKGSTSGELDEDVGTDNPLMGALVTPLVAQNTTVDAAKTTSQAESRSALDAVRTSRSREEHDAKVLDKSTLASDEKTAARDGKQAFTLAAAQGDAAADQRDGKFLNAVNTLNGASASTPDASTLTATAQSAQNSVQLPAAQQLNATAASPTPTFTATLDAPVGSDPWNQSLGQQAMRLSNVGNGQAELILNPPELGQLHVTLKMGEQQAQLHFASPHAQVRAAVEAALPQLRDALAESGISLGQTSVSDQGNNQAFNFQQQSQSRSSAAGSYGAAITDEAIASATIIPINGRNLSGGIDIFA